MSQAPTSDDPTAAEEPKEPVPSATSLIGAGFAAEIRQLQGKEDADDTPAPSDDGDPADDQDDDELREPEDLASDEDDVGDADDPEDTPEPAADDLEPDPEPLIEPVAVDPEETPEAIAEKRAGLAQRWGQALANNPKRISEVPRQLMGEAVQQAMQAAAEYGAGRVAAEAEMATRKREQEAYDAGVTQTRDAIQTEQNTAALDLMAEEEPEEFAQLVRAGTDPRVVNYLNRKKADAAPAVDPRISGAADELMNQAQAAGVAQNLVAIQQANPDRYEQTGQGLANLRSDVKGLIAQARGGCSSHYPCAE